jgi:hypothetical protein
MREMESGFINIIVGHRDDPPKVRDKDSRLLFCVAPWILRSGAPWRDGAQSEYKTALLCSSDQSTRNAS